LRRCAGPEWRAVTLAIFIVGASSAPSAAQHGPQPVRLSDGDSFSLGRERYRLQGIDAPELRQECKDAAGRAWPCGNRARSELRRIIGTHPVQCRTVSTDRYGRNIAVCKAGGRDIAEEMVRSGFATIIDRRGASNPYAAAQAEARADKRGLWAGSFENPGEWRRANPRREDGTVPLPPSPRDWLANRASALWQAITTWLQSVFGR
jgi:endonuclease YncB( thermonuclease family)